MDITQEISKPQNLPNDKYVKSSSSPLGLFFKRQGAFFKSKAVYKHKLVNKKLLNKFKFTGYFLYGVNQESSDITLARLTEYPKESDFVLSQNDFFKDDNSLFTKSRRRIYSGKSIVVMLDKEQSSNKNELFELPILLDVPAFSFTNVYKKRGSSKTPNIITYIDGPFYPNSNLSQEEQKEHLKEQIFECIIERESLSDSEFKNLSNNKGINKNDN